MPARVFRKYGNPVFKEARNRHFHVQPKCITSTLKPCIALSPFSHNRLRILAMPVTTSAAVRRLSASLTSLGRGNKIAIMVALDLACLTACSLISMVLRTGEVHSALRFGISPHLLIALLTVTAFYTAGLYSAVVRYIGNRLLMISGLYLALVVALTCLLSLIFNYGSLPRSAVAIYWFIAFSYVVASRLAARALLRNGNPRPGYEKHRRVAIYGAGEAGAKLANAMRSGNEYLALCFFDDRLALASRNVAGLKVFHSTALRAVVQQRHIELVVIAIPSATPEQRRVIVEKIQQAGVVVKVLSNLVELANEEISIKSIRDVKINDLLGREPIQPKPELFSACILDKNVLVTGAGGSIGSELCRQILTQKPARLHLLDHSEHALYNIEQELAAHYPHNAFQIHLGSVGNAALVERIVKENAIDTIYHAAAYKHVPLVEFNMAEGICNNIKGAEVISSVAARHRVETCVLISTDKAVRPTSCMGASKRIAEMIFQAEAITSPSTRFCSVRFGNVLGSSGSVVPLFKRQIEHGGPITITHPDIERYFMSIPEAVQLVIQAGAMAVGGDVFVMDMGAPVKIVDLARTMLAMSGLKEKSSCGADGDIEIRFVGLRPGEKLYEELFVGKNILPTMHPRIMMTREPVVDPETLKKQIAYLMLACSTNDIQMIRLLLKRIVEGYTSSANEAESGAFLAEAAPVQVIPGDSASWRFGLSSRWRQAADGRR